MNNQSISIDKRCASNLILDNDFTINYMIPLYGRLYYKNPKHSSSFLNDILRVSNQTSNPRQKEVHNNIDVSVEVVTVYSSSSNASNRSAPRKKKKEKEGIKNGRFLAIAGAVIFLSSSYFVGRVWNEYSNVRDDLNEERENAKCFSKHDIEYKLSVNINQPIMNSEKNDAWCRLAARVAILVGGLGIFGAVVIGNEMLLLVSGTVTLLGMGFTMVLWGSSGRVISQNRRILRLANKKLMVGEIMPPQNPQYSINPSKATQNAKHFDTYPEPSAPPFSPEEYKEHKQMSHNSSRTTA